MLEPNNVPPVADNEMLARFIVNSNEFRKDDQSVKPKLFMPFKLVKLSVNRHLDCTTEETWQFGRNVAKQRNKTFYGRSDILASSCRLEPLDVVDEPIEGNPNHADVVGFPPKKEDQMSLATKLAALATDRLTPEESSDAERR